MPVAILGINNDAVNLVINLLILFLVAVWLALVWWTYVDARRRLSDQVLVGCSVAVALVPFVGSLIYSILRPPEYLEDTRERELETRAAELQLRALTEGRCSTCGHTIERNFLVCPNCARRLKYPCGSCARPVSPSWHSCPYCEAELRPREQSQRSRRTKRRSDRGEGVRA